MIKFLGESPDGPVIGLGLSKRNVDLLQQGKPIEVNMADLHKEGHIIIFYGDTEEQMRTMLEYTGIVGPDTPRVHKDKADG